MTENEKEILRLWAKFKTNPDSKDATSILKAIVAINRKAR